MMNFVFWTFLKKTFLSILHFLDEMFFCRTEKSGHKIGILFRCDNAMVIFCIFNGFFETFVNHVLTS
jgi:hypothetical protein